MALPSSLSTCFCICKKDLDTSKVLLLAPDQRVISASNFRLPNQTSGFGTAYWPLVISVSICGQFLGDQLQKLVLLQFTIHLLNIGWPRKVVIYLNLFKMSNTRLWPLVFCFLKVSRRALRGTKCMAWKNEQEKAHMSITLFFYFLIILSLYHIQSYMCSVEGINLSFIWSWFIKWHHPLSYLSEITWPTIQLVCNLVSRPPTPFVPVAIVLRTLPCHPP